MLRKVLHKLTYAFDLQAPPVDVLYEWDPSAISLQSLINGITDATSNKVYDIIIPPGQGGAYDYVGALTL